MANGVPDELSLFHKRQMVLMVRAASENAPATRLDHASREFEVTCLPGCARKLHERHFGFGMSTSSGPTVWAKLSVEQIGIALGYIEEVSSAGSAIVGHGGLKEMAGAVDFMHVAEIGEAVFGTVEHEVGVEIAIGLLGGGDFGDDGLHLIFEVSIRLVTDGVGDSFKQFIDVGVVEVDSLKIDLFFAGGTSKVIYTSGLFAALDLRGKRYRTIGLQAWCPESVFQPNRLQRQRLHRGERALSEGDHRPSRLSRHGLSPVKMQSWKSLFQRLRY